jgi:hypothetical protein
MDGKAISDLLGEMYGRMKDYLLGKGKKGEIAGSIQELARGAKWMMIKEHGAHSRLRTFQENLPLQGLIVFKGGVDDTYRYSAVRRNQLSIFPIELLSTCLNQAERLIEQGGLKAFNDLLSKKNGQATALWQELAAVKPPQEWVKPWGGGDAVIGCLRQKGSLIPPASMDPFMSKFMEDLAERAYQLNCHSLKDPLVPDA